jgi:hypothetical protein
MKRVIIVVGFLCVPFLGISQSIDNFNLDSASTRLSEDSISEVYPKEVAVGNKQGFQKFSNHFKGSAQNTSGFSASNNLSLRVYEGGSVSIAASGNIVVANDIIVNDNGQLTINSNAEDSGAIVVLGTATGALTYKRHIPSNNWHFVSAPVTTQNIADFISNPENNILRSSKNNYSVSVYNNKNPKGDRWEYYKSPIGVFGGNFQSGMGYSNLRGSDAIHTFTFKGNIVNADPILGGVSVSVGIALATNHKWNLIGNPYPSFLPANLEAGALNLLLANLDNLDDNFAYLQFWNGESYQVVNLADETPVYLAPGQGFMIASKVANDSFLFPKNLQIAKIETPVTFYKPAVSAIPQITLQLSDGINIDRTRLKYYSSSTRGLDKGFDAGRYTDTALSFSIDTHLVTESKGVDFTLQCLPNTNYETSVVPISIKSKADVTLTFSTTSTNLPADIHIFLEDRELGDVADITNMAHEVKLANALVGIGRFYLHTAASLGVLGGTQIGFDATLKIYKTSATNVIITGLQEQGGTVFRMYSVLGKEVLVQNLEASNVHNVTLPNNLASGVYLIKLSARGKERSQKIILE